MIKVSNSLLLQLQRQRRVSVAVDQDTILVVDKIDLLYTKYRMSAMNCIFDVDTGVLFNVIIVNY